MKKKYYLIGLAIVIIGISIGGFVIHQHRQEEKRVETELEIIHTYLRLHYAFAIIGDHYTFRDLDRDRIYGHSGIYRPMESENDHGISAIPYLLMKFYYHRTGNYLSYELIRDYFSEEFDPDGSLRLYNNGNHPEMEAFVTWMWEGRREEEFSEYLRRIIGINSSYSREHRELGFVSKVVDDLSPQMLDALARAEADPEYVLDLTSLQEAGY